LEDLVGSEELVKIQILTFLRVIRDSVHVAPKKGPGFLGYSNSSSLCDFRLRAIFDRQIAGWFPLFHEFEDEFEFEFDYDRRIRIEDQRNSGGPSAPRSY
jgi:hypothetical protein